MKLVTGVVSYLTSSQPLGQAPIQDGQGTRLCLQAQDVDGRRNRYKRESECPLDQCLEGRKNERGS